MSGWATRQIEQLKAGAAVSFRPKGNSMEPIIKSGQLCTCEPVDINTVLEVGNVVLCKVNGRQYLHKISAIRDNQYQISNNKNFVNGWTQRTNVFGILTKVE